MERVPGEWGLQVFWFLFFFALGRILVGAGKKQLAVQGVLILFWAVRHLSVEWTAGKILLLFYTVPCGVFFFMALLTMQASLSIKSVQSLEFMNVLTYGGVQTAQYPLRLGVPSCGSGFYGVVPIVLSQRALTWYVSTALKMSG